MMANTRTKAPKHAPDVPAEPPPIIVRGLTPADAAALERIVARRREALQAQAPGAYLSRNAVVLSLLRDAIAREASS